MSGSSQLNARTAVPLGLRSQTELRVIASLGTSRPRRKFSFCAPTRSETEYWHPSLAARSEEAVFSDPLTYQCFCERTSSSRRSRKRRFPNLAEVYEVSPPLRTMRRRCRQEKSASQAPPESACVLSEIRPRFTVVILRDPRFWPRVPNLLVRRAGRESCQRNSGGPGVE